MAWISISEDDLIAKLSEGEVAAYRRRSWAKDPIAPLLSMVTAHARGAIRTGGRCTMSPDESLIPASVVGYAIDFAVFDLLKRLSLPVTEDRRKARDEAVDFFKRLEKGEFEPESYGVTDTASVGIHAAQLVNSSPNRVTPQRLNGW